MLFIYLKFIKYDDFEIHKKWSLPFIYLIIFIRGIYAWIGAIIFAPFLIFGMIFEKRFEKQIKKMIEYNQYILK